MNHVVLNITNRCNFKCRTCIRGRCSPEDINFNDLAKCMREGRKLGIDTAVVTGGEPILHPDFDRIIAMLVDLDIRFGLITNGWTYQQYSQILAPVKKSVRFIGISLDGHTPKVNDSNRHPGSFKRATAAIKHFQSEGYPVRLSHIVNTDNAKHLMSFVRLFRDQDVRINIGCAIKNETNRPTNITDLQRQKFRAQLRALASAHKDKIMTASSAGLSRELLFCSNFANMHGMVIQFDGKVVFCCDLIRQTRGAVLGDIKTEKLADIIPRYGKALGRIVEGRIKSILAGRWDKDNDCDFCNRMLAKEVHA